MNGPACRGLFSCSVRAINSFPVPVSPRMQTRVSLAATCSTCAITSRITALAHTISCLPSRRFNSRFSCSRRETCSACSTVSNSLSVEIGFSRKSDAPSRVAFTAISIVACPDIITTGDATPHFCKSSSSEIPSRPGITTSDKIRSNRSAFARSRARAALSQTVASCPASRNARDSDASVFASSSMIRMFALSGTRG